MKIYKTSNWDSPHIFSNSEKEVDPEEESSIAFKENIEKFSSTQTLLSHYLNTKQSKLNSISIAADFIKKKNLSRVLSLGSGYCVLDYLLKLSLNKNAELLATDFNSFYIDSANKYLSPAIKATIFDMYHGNITELLSSQKISPDVAIFWGSAYSINSERYISLLESIRENGIEYVIDFHAGFLPFRTYIRLLVTRNKLIRNLFKKGPINQGRFYGYSRNRIELRSIYKSGGFVVEKELYEPMYKYISFLRSKKAR